MPEYRVVFVPFPGENFENLAAAATSVINEHVQLGWHFVSLSPITPEYGMFVTFGFSPAQ